MAYTQFDITFLLLSLAFIAGVLLLSVAVSVLGGWFTLAKRYPVPQNTGKVFETHKWKSLTIGYLTGYRSLISFTVTDKGILIRPSLFLLLLHKPMFLPWREITGMEYKGGLLKRIIIRIDRTRLVASGKTAKAIFKVYNNERRKEI